MEEKPNECDLPSDIVYEILLTLRVKTLSRFQCVCKVWHSLISSSIFQQGHFNRCSQQDPLILTARDGTDKKSGKDNLTLSTYNIEEADPINEFSTATQRRYRFLSTASCRGLLCIGSKTDMYYRDDHPILLCNPSTEELLPLPHPTKGFMLHIIEIGYAASTKEVKVVLFFTLPGRSQLSCEIFTLGTNEWRAARSSPLEHLKLCHQAIFVKGALHFMPYRVNKGAVQVIDAFDIESEEYKCIPLPEYKFRAEPIVNYLNELRDSLYFVLVCKGIIELWRLMDYENGRWLKEYTIDLTSLNSFYWPHRLRFTGEAHLLMCCTTFKRPNMTLHSYNPRDKIFTPKKKFPFRMRYYVESFLPLGSRW